MGQAQIQDMREGNAAATERDQPRMQQWRFPAVEQPSTGPEQSDADSGDPKRARHAVPTITANQWGQCERACARDEDALEAMVAEKAEAERGQYGEHERQCRAVDRTQERRGRTDTVGDVRQRIMRGVVAQLRGGRAGHG